MMLEFLESEHINPDLLRGLEAYRKEFPTPA